MPYKRSLFILKHRLRYAGRWHSPYHRIAHELTIPKRKSTVRRLLEFGLITRAAEFLKNPNLSTPSCEAQLAFQTGQPELAQTIIINALRNLPTNHKEVPRLIKLLTRLQPESAITWALKINNKRLAIQIETAINPKKSLGIFTLNSPKKDEHLLISNTKETTQEKIEYLNSFFSEEGLNSVILVDKELPFDINNLSSGFNSQPSKLAPFVSVIMTVYNGEEFIQSAAQSILNQIGVRVELIIIDDGSTDNTSYIINSIKSRHPNHIKTKILSTNIGTYKAKNIALKMCQGDFIAFQDADDWSHPQRLIRSIAWIQKSSSRIAATCRYVRLDRNSIFYSPQVWPLQQWSPNTLVFRRSIVLDKLGGFDEVKMGADTEFFERIRLYFGDRQLLLSKTVMLIAMQLPTSLMHNEKTGINKMGYSLARTAYREKRSEEYLHALRLDETLKIPI